MGKGGSAGVQKTNAEAQKTQTAHSTHADFYKAPLRKVVCGDKATHTNVADPRSATMAATPRATREPECWPMTRNSLRHGLTEAAPLSATCTVRKSHDSGQYEPQAKKYQQPRLNDSKTAR